MPVSKYSKEFKQQIVLDVFQRSHTISEVVAFYGFCADHGELDEQVEETYSGIEDEELTSA